MTRWIGKTEKWISPRCYLAVFLCHHIVEEIREVARDSWQDRVLSRRRVAIACYDELIEERSDLARVQLSHLVHLTVRQSSKPAQNEVVMCEQFLMIHEHLNATELGVDWYNQKCYV